MSKKPTTKTAARKPAPRARRPRKTLQFLEKPTCATCQKARQFLEKRGYKLNYRDLIKEQLSVSELENLIGKHNHENFLRSSSALFREKNMKDNPPSRREAISLMAKDPELIRRPVIVAGGRVVIGYDENGMIRF
ncbi:MAG TPA: ArsC/Spx/MgsR family protein [Candidatus Acidoferrales bacterium]|nr:ArsC/Spx/MgsR family protein [Candidatus Acidoferrales bacterium]